MESTYLDQLWQVLLGTHAPTPPRQIPVVTSITYYSLAMLTGRFLRSIITSSFPTRTQPYLLDMAVTFQVLCCSLENSQISKHYGMGAYGFVLFVLSMWHYSSITNGSANPCAHVIRFLNKKLTAKQFLLRVMCQTLGGLASYQCAKFFWRLELTESHSLRYKQTHCVTDLSVSTYQGFLIEFGGTVLDTMLCLTTFSPFFMMEAATKMLIGCGLTLIGVHTTGYYLNPINATNQTFGCRGLSVWEHIMIYWMGPLSATAISFQLHTFLSRLYAQYNYKSTRKLLQYSPSITFDEIDELRPEDSLEFTDAPWEFRNEEEKDFVEEESRENGGVESKANGQNGHIRRRMFAEGNTKHNGKSGAVNGTF